MNNLKSVLAALIVVGMTAVASAQYAVGLKVGGNIADASLSGISEQFLPEQLSYPGVVIGAMAEIPMLNGFSFRPELNYMQKGFTVRVSKDDFDLFGVNLKLSGKNETRLNYLEVPLLIKYSYGNSLAKAYAVAGPTVGFAMNGYAQQIATAIIDIKVNKSSLPLEKDAFQRWELGLAVGLGGEIKAGHGKIFGDVRYDFGLNSIIHNTIIDFKAKNRGFNISAGYAYVF